MRLKNIDVKKIVVLFLYLKLIQVSIAIFSRFKKVINILKIALNRCRGGRILKKRKKRVTILESID